MLHYITQDAIHSHYLCGEDLFHPHCPLLSTRAATIHLDKPQVPQPRCLWPHTHTRAHTFFLVHTYKHTHSQIHSHRNTHTHTHTLTQMHTHTHMHTQMRACTDTR